MSYRTLVLQLVCCAFGVLFMAVDFMATQQVSEGGLFFGWLFFFMASLLGADHSANRNGSFRRVFRALVIVLSIPFVAVCVLQLIGPSDFGLLTGLSLVVKLLVVCACVVGMALEDHPMVQRVAKRLGLSTPNPERTP